MRYHLLHRTEYQYDSIVSRSQHVLHLQPRVTEWQRVLAYELSVEPVAESSSTHVDFFGNIVNSMAVGTPHTKLSILARSEVEATARTYPHPQETPPWEQVRDLCPAAWTEAGAAPGEFLGDSPIVTATPAIRAWAAQSFTPGRPLLAGVLDLTGRIHRRFQFDPKATTVATPVVEAFRQRRGVCQDFAHLGLACLRSLGLAARYVSGYLETVPPPGRARLAGADASHAWFAVWCPGLGWIDADPTNNLLPSFRHLTVGWGRDFSDVSPVRGVASGGGEHQLSVAVDVEPQMVES